ncbi:MAG: hypothetical protein K8W52_43885 [Deltaproteobacteria bacterium]|nr:hypothetical protein [Deltaproteobacteria bacterium]
MQHRLALAALLALAACGSSNKGSADAAGADAASPDAAVPDGMPDADTTPDATPDAYPAAPVFRNPLTTPDDQLALQALQILGANVPGARADSCNHCHSATRQNIRYWRAVTDTAMTTCFTDLAVTSQESAKSMLDCLRIDPTMPATVFSPHKFGVFATAARLPWFAYTANRAYGADGPSQLANLIDQGGMPRGTITPLTQDDFDIVAEWFLRGVPLLDETLPEDPAPSTCQTGVSADVGAHVNAMATTGWRVQDKNAGMLMHGCVGAATTLDCLSTYPDASTTTYGATWNPIAGDTLRVLKEVTYRSSYWTRSSASGRFIGHGTSTGAAIIDLQRDVVMNVSALYDPGFFPDDSGFVFQGSNNGNVCPMSVLTANPTAVKMNEPGCSDVGQVGLYQHLGATLGGGDYFSIDGEFVNDDGGHSSVNRSTDPDAWFSQQSQASLTPMIFNGSTYTPKASINVATPYEGDPVISPSAKLMVTRVAGPTNAQLGYVLHKVNATPSGGTYTVSTPEIARYCVAGGKPAFSYDERWMIFHHYVANSDAVELGFTGPNDPAFAAYKTKGASNIYLLDLVTGVKTRITNVAAGQYALYPHFRADGWIYFIVRKPDPTPANRREYMVASDAALRLE